MGTYVILNKRCLTFSAAIRFVRHFAYSWFSTSTLLYITSSYSTEKSFAFYFAGLICGSDAKISLISKLSQTMDKLQN